MPGRCWLATPCPTVRLNGPSRFARPLKIRIGLKTQIMWRKRRASCVATPVEDASDADMLIPHTREDPRSKRSTKATTP